MGLGGKLKQLRYKVGDAFGHVMDKVAGDQPDCAAAPIVTRPPKRGMSMSEVETASAGFPPEIR